jgi:hypothetical protein
MLRPIKKNFGEYELMRHKKENNELCRSLWIDTPQGGLRISYDEEDQSLDISIHNIEKVTISQSQKTTTTINTYSPVLKPVVIIEERELEDITTPQYPNM